MRKIIGFFALAASLLLAPVSAFAQNTSNLAATDKVLVTRVDANGVGTPGAVVVGQVFNGTGIGYSAGTGAGCAVTQGTSRTTAVICAGYAGQITMFSAAGSATAATFTVTDSKVISTDTVEIMQASGTNLYTVIITAVANGSFNVTFFTTGGTATDAPVLNFTVIHAATS
jgi:hypothetical protein